MRAAPALIALLLMSAATLLQADSTDNNIDSNNATSTNVASNNSDDALWQQQPAALDDPLLRAIATQLAQPQQLARRFEQQKQLKILQRPLRTAGVMLYRAGQGVCWHTEKPIVSTLVLEPAQLRQLGERGDGSDELVVGAAEQPALFGFTQLFFSLLAGQVDSAAEQFELRVTGDASDWRIGLLPRSALLRRFIARMQLGGGDQIEQVVVTDPEGDRTLIQFAPLNAIAPALESRCFGSAGE